MSATSMGRLAALRTAQLAPDSTAPAGSSTANAAKAKSRANENQQTQLGKIAAYTPSEALSFYIAGLALIVSFPEEARQAGLWATVAIAVIANFGLTLLAFKQTLKGTVGGALATGRFWAAIGLATLALAVYAVAIPGNPFLGPLDYWAPFILLAGVLIVPLIATLGGLNPKPASDS